MNAGIPTMTPMVHKMLTNMTAPFLKPIMTFPHWLSFQLRFVSANPKSAFSVQGWEATNDP